MSTKTTSYLASGRILARQELPIWWEGAAVREGLDKATWRRDVITLEEVRKLIDFEPEQLDIYNSKGELSLLRVETSPVIRALRALSQPVVEFEAALPSVDELVRVARESPSTPAWLAQATEARAGDELVQRLDAVGLIARHAYGPAVDSIRGWAQALVPADTARLEQMILRHVERAYDALDEALDGDTFATHMLVYERDRLESLLALRSFAGMGSPVRESVRQLDDHVLGLLVLLPDPAPGAFEDDPSIAAADGLAPNAWWADYAR